MNRDLYRLGGLLALFLFAGIVAGEVFLFGFLGLLVYVYWQYKALGQLLLWMQRRKEVESPDMPGYLDEIAKQFDFLRIRHKKRKKKLSSYIKRFKDATRALPDAVLILGEQDEIEWANGKAEEYLGIRNAQDKGQRLVNLIRHPNLIKFMSEIRRKKDLQFEKTLELISPVNKDVHLELRLVSYGASEKLLVARDITKIHRINRMRRDFIANASHELRTPLTVISGYLESLEDDLSDQETDDDRRVRVGQMRKQTERMRRLIEDLLKLSSLETTEPFANKEPVRVADMLSNIIEEARALGGGTRLNFEVEADSGLLVEGDRNQIYSAISNVVFNAVQHTPDQGRIIIRWFQDGRSAVLEVSDTGEGISAEHIPRITERFYRVDSGRSRNKGGTGLGLAIVKHILARHNAKLEIESRPGEGSTFRFVFPAVAVMRRDIITDRLAAG